MPRIYFSNTKKHERKYLTELLKEKKWFKDANFTNIFLPKDKRDIELIIARRLPKSFKDRINRLEKSWKKIEPDFFRVIKSFKRKKLLSKYQCHISRLGPEGKYRRPNLLFVRLRIKKDDKRMLETIAHEVLHLSFADFLESKKATYPEREGIVDTLITQSGLKKLLPRYEVQSIGKVNQKWLKEIL